MYNLASFFCHNCFSIYQTNHFVLGAHADVILIDEDIVDSDPVAMRPDLPGGAARLYAGATGIDDVLVAGVPVVADGAFTKYRPGRVLRSGTDSR